VSRFSYHIVTLFAVVLLVPAIVEAQTSGSSVTLKGSISETVALSIVPNSTHANIGINVVSSGSTARMTLSGTDAESQVIRVPLIVRSNRGFRISAVAESRTALLAQLSVVAVRATGTLVSPNAVNELDIAQQFDLRGLDEKASSATSSLQSDVSRPMHLLSGPRVSLGGTRDSPNNALQITFLISIKPESGRSWSLDLTFSAMP